MADSERADSKGSVGGQPSAGPNDTRGVGAVPRAPVPPAASHATDQMLRLVLCLLFLGSSAISLTGLILLIGWIVAL